MRILIVQWLRRMSDWLDSVADRWDWELQNELRKALKEEQHDYIQQLDKEKP